MSKDQTIDKAAATFSAIRSIVLKLYEMSPTTRGTMGKTLLHIAGLCERMAEELRKER